MNSKTYVKILLASFLLGIGISVVGCGSSGNNNPVPPSGNIFAPSTRGSLTPENCFVGGGTRMRAADGTDVCKVTLVPEVSVSESFYGKLIRLTPSSSAEAKYVGVDILPQDTMTMDFVSGGWGETRFLTTSHCDDIDPRGYDTHARVQLFNENKESGFYISSGGQLFPARSHSVITFDQAGPLRYGFNAPASSGNCYDISLRFKIERCLDIASLPHKCK